MRHVKSGVAFGFMLMICFAIAAAVCAHGKNDWPVPPEARKMKNPVPSNSASIDAGFDLYTIHCANCHGDDGKGDGPDADMYDLMPADFTDAHMMKEMTDGEIFYKITEGRKPMPSFKTRISDEQRWQLVNFLRTFVPKPAPPPAKPPAKKSAPTKH